MIQSQAVLILNMNRLKKKLDVIVKDGGRRWQLVIGDRLNFIIDHRLESVGAFDAILPIIIGSLIFTELNTFYALGGNSGASGFFSFVQV